MKKWLVILAVLTMQTQAFAIVNHDIEAGNIVQLISHTSQYARITGTVSNVDISDKFNAISLNFGKNFNTSLSAVIYNDVIQAFASAGIIDPAKYFADKTVVLEGIIRILNGKPQIIIDFPSQIKIIN